MPVLSDKHFPYKSAIGGLAVYDGDRNKRAFTADVLRPVTYGAVGRHRSC